MLESGDKATDEENGGTHMSLESAKSRVEETLKGTSMPAATLVRQVASEVEERETVRAAIREMINDQKVVIRPDLQVALARNTD